MQKLQGCKDETWQYWKMNFFCSKKKREYFNYWAILRDTVSLGYHLTKQVVMQGMPRHFRDEWIFLFSYPSPGCFTTLCKAQRIDRASSR